MTINVRTSLAGLIAATVTLAATNSQAGTNSVSNLNDSGVGSLRQLILISAAGDTIVFSNSVAGVLTLSSELSIGRNLTILGPTSARVVLDGNLVTRVFNMIGGTVKISNLTIFRGRAFGAAGANGTIGSPVGGAGGGIGGGGVLVSNAVVTLEGCTLLGNGAVGGDGGNAALGGDGAGGDGGIAYGGGIFVLTGAVTLVHCTLSGNFAQGGRGGIGYGSGSGGGGGAGFGGGIVNQGTIVLTNCTLAGNAAAGGNGNNGYDEFHGGNGGLGAVGGLYQIGAGSIRNTLIANNTVGAGSGGIGGSSGGALAPDAAVTFSSLGFNLIGESDYSSGWIASDLIGTVAAPLDPVLDVIRDNGGPTFTRALLAGSSAIDRGNSGGLATDQRGHPRIYGSPLAGGGDGSDIGAYELNPPLTLFVTNSNDSLPGSLRHALVLADLLDSISFAASVTGTVALSYGELAIDKNVTIFGPASGGVTVSGNNSSRVFHIKFGNVNISGLTIAGANTNVPGAGVFNETGCTLALSNCTVSGNVSGDSGGGVANNGTVTAVNCTFFGNRAANGGGAYNYAGTFNLFNSTVASNAATTAGGGVYNYPVGGSVANVRSSIIASNSAPDSPDVKGAFTSLWFNFIANITGSTGFPAGSDLTGIDPKLGPLADNGGPSKTMALRVGSRAIDAGKSFGLTTDQRGQPRVYDDPNVTSEPSGGDSTDIGAYEASELRMVNAQKTGNHLRLDFTCQLGTNYEVQSRSDLNTGNWASLAGATPGNGGLASTTVSNAFGVPKQFYRVHPVP